MEPADDPRIVLESKLNAIMTGIPALIQQTDKLGVNVPIKNLEDFVFGMIYQQFYRAIVITNVKSSHEHPQTSSNLSDWIDIGLDLFRNKSREIRDTIQNRSVKPQIDSSQNNLPKPQNDASHNDIQYCKRHFWLL